LWTPNRILLARWPSTRRPQGTRVGQATGNNAWSADSQLERKHDALQRFLMERGKPAWRGDQFTFDGVPSRR
jgi:hypothetical protein